MTGDRTTRLRERLRQALPEAMRRRDPAAVRALRSALAAIDNAEAVAAPAPPTTGNSPIAGAVSGLGATEAVRGELSESQVAAVVRTEVADRRAAAADYQRLGRSDDALRLIAEADSLASLLDDP